MIRAREISKQLHQPRRRAKQFGKNGAEDVGSERRHDCATRMRFCQWVHTNQTTPMIMAAKINASNLWRYLPISRQFWPNFIPSHARPKHQGHDPMKV